MKMTIDGRELNLDPIADSGIGVGRAVTMLRSGQAVGWTMEPGDMTRYKVLLVPCWSNVHTRVASGMDYGSAEAFILLTYVSDTMPLSRPVGRYCGHWDLTDYGITNEWTARVLAGLARGVWECLLDDGIDPSVHEVPALA